VIPMRDIRAFARRITAEFKPQRIILFGSYAYGTPSEDSDVDILVVMPYRGHAADKAIEILLRVDFHHPLDLIVRSEAELRRRYKIEDWFIREIIDRGKILYEALDSGVARKGKRGLALRRNSVPVAKGAKL